MNRLTSAINSGTHFFLSLCCLIRLNASKVDLKMWKPTFNGSIIDFQIHLSNEIEVRGNINK